MFAGTYARGAAAEIVTSAGWLQAMLDVEAALARAGAAEGLLPAAHGEAIAQACRAERFDRAALEAEGGEHATPVVGLVRALRAAVGPEVAVSVHVGATSQDVVDSAAMLLARRALAPLLADAEGAAAAAAALADAHRRTPMAGRTLLQLALPTTFGARAAGWLTGIDAARTELGRVAERGLAVQLGGPVGLGAPGLAVPSGGPTGSGARGPAAQLGAPVGSGPRGLAARVAEELGLVAPVVPWQTDRTRVAALGAALGVLAGALAKPALDVVLLAQGEVGEVREGGAGRGASSAMAHKRNPVAAVSVRACAARTPGLVATLLAGMPQEHERAAGAWQAEWGTLTDLLALTGSTAAWARDLLEHLEVDPARMAENLTRLTRASGPGGLPGEDARAQPDAHLDAADALVSAALAAHRAVAPAGSDAPAPPARVVRRPGVPLHAAVSGPAGAAAVVLASSLGTTHAMWAPQVAALAATRRVVAYDHRGHGGSPVPDGPYALDDLGMDALDLLDRLGIERASWCGISLGGMVGMWLAAHAPERIDRLALVCTSAHLGPAAGWHERAATVRAAGSVAPVAEAVLARWLTPAWAATHPAERSALRRLLEASPAEGYAACCEAIAAMDLRDVLPDVAAPTLVLAGAQDQATPPVHGQEIAAAIPRARLVLLDPAAHLASVEQPAAVTRLIADHLEAP